MNEERLAELMVRAADDLVTPAEEAELAQHLRRHPELRQELDAHRRIRAVTEGWVKRLDLDLAEDVHNHDPRTRWEARIGLGMLFVGVGILSGFGLAEMMTAPDVPLWVRAGLGLTLSGTIVLLLSVIRWRLATRPHDAYKEVIR